MAFPVPQCVLVPGMLPGMAEGALMAASSAGGLGKG